MPGGAVPLARARARLTRTHRLESPRLRGYRYKPTSGHRLSFDRVTRTLRSRLRFIDPASTVWVRARGGTPEYRNRWWSAAPIAAGELDEMDDDELQDYLRDLDDPWELDIISEK